MTCRELVELVTEYLEDALPVDDRRRFDEHLGLCPRCVRYIEQINVTLRTVGRIEEDSISPAARDSLLHAFRDWKAERAS
jgi:anti-sigma factor RsiW